MEISGDDVVDELCRMIEATATIEALVWADNQVKAIKEKLGGFDEIQWVFLLNAHNRAMTRLQSHG